MKTKGISKLEEPGFAITAIATDSLAKLWLLYNLQLKSIDFTLLKLKDLKSFSTSGNILQRLTKNFRQNSMALGPD